MTGHLHEPSMVILLVTLVICVATSMSIRRGGCLRGAIAVLLIIAEGATGIYLSVGGHL